jgi:Protein of unknown function (DUF1266)
MNPQTTQIITYVVLGIVAAYYLTTKVLPFFKKAKTVLSDELIIDKKSTLSKDQYRKIALGSILSQQSGAPLNTLKTGEKDFEKLKEWWGIDSTASATETLDWLVQAGHRIFFPVIYQAFTSPEAMQENIIRNQGYRYEEDTTKALSQLKNLKDTFQFLKNDKVVSKDSELQQFGIGAWDFGRIVMVTRWCFDCGYITEQQAWKYIDEANVLAKSSYFSWSDFSKSYVIGRAVWGGTKQYASYIADTARDLLEKPNSPWVELPW